VVVRFCASKALKDWNTTIMPMSPMTMPTRMSIRLNPR
jgi:hypothetical protein